jgi:hypothetical protein
MRAPEHHAGDREDRRYGAAKADEQGVVLPPSTSRTSTVAWMLRCIIVSASLSAADHTVANS